MSLPLDMCLYLAAALFSVGVYGVLSRQNLIVLLMSLELMLNAVNVALIGLGRAFFAVAPGETEANAPHVFVLIVLAVAAAEAAIGLSLVLAVYRRWRTTSSGDINILKG